MSVNLKKKSFSSYYIMLKIRRLKAKHCSFRLEGSLCAISSGCTMFASVTGMFSIFTMTSVPFTGIIKGHFSQICNRVTALD